MYKGIATLNAYELCLRRGFCECHLKEVDQNECAVQQDELPRKAFLFIRINILSTILFKRSTKCEKIKILLQRTPIFSRILANGDASEAADDILVLDSVVIFTLCELSKICCIGALFQINDITSEDPDIKHLQELLLVDRIDGTILKHLYPILQKNFVGFDLDLVKVSYVLTLLFVRNYCIKLDIKTAFKTIEEEFRGDDVQYESLKHMGDLAYKNGQYGMAVATYTSAIMLNWYSSAMFTNRAQVYLKLEQLKAAQLDAYIAVAIDPKSCEGYFAFASSFNRQQLYEDAYGVAKYGLANCDSKDLFYKTLETLHIELGRKLNKIESYNNESEVSVNPNESTEKSIEKKYFPQLVDSDSADSDEETKRKDIPELVEASSDSDSDISEKKTVNIPIKNKTKKKRIATEDTSDSVSTQIDMNKIHTCLKEASEAILSDCGYKAVQIFRGPLRNFIESSELNNLEECEIVCIKYAYGIAYCKSGGYDDLWKCITILKEITEKHDSVTFPATYYALGLAYRKLNRFKEALNYLETVNNFLSKGIHFKVYPWPETPTGIQETKAEILKDLVHDLIKECENPPNPDAFCRFIYCTYQPTIYYTDPDFKGYISLYCSEQCCLQYHLQCWKTLKNEKNKTDKEFLEEACFTPDCEGIIIKIQNIDKKGDLAKEFTSDFKKTGKQKWAKWEKKTDVKEKKKKKGTSKSEDNTQDIPCENGKVNSRKNSDANDKSNSIQISGSATLVENDTSSENKQKSSDAVTMELDMDPKKDDKTTFSAKSVQEVNDVPKMSSKNQNNKDKIPSISCDTNSYELGHKKEVQDVPQDFKRRNECNTTLETANNIDVLKNKSKCNDRNAHVSNDFQDNKFSVKLEPEKTSEFLVSQCIKNNVYSFMFDFLQHHGPLRIDDVLLIGEMSSFPDEVNSMIAECGGIGEFLKNDLRFAFVGDSYICVVSDLATAYKMNSNSLTSDFEKLPLGRHFKYYEYEFRTDVEQQNCGLNPDAVEYKPTVSSAKNKNADNQFYNQKSFPYLSDSSSHKIDDTQKMKSKSCDTVLNCNGNNSEPSLSASVNSEQDEVNVEKENNKRLLVDYVDKLELNSVFSNSVSNVNSNQKHQENDENLSTFSVDFSSCNQNAIKNPNSMLENSKIKKIQTQLLPLLKEYCSEDYNKYHSYVDACIKPYSLRKLPDTVCVETETEFEKSEKETSAEHLEQVSEALKALNKQLTEKNLSLENQVVLASKQKQDLLEEISKLKISLAGSSNDIEVLKRNSKKKEEEILNGREYLIKSLTDAHTRIDDMKKRIALLESLNSRLGKTVGDLTLSINEGAELKKKALEDEKRNSLTVKTLQEENDKFKSRVKFAEIQYLLTKKTEYLNRIEDKLRDASIKKQEFTHGLSMLSGSLNPMVHSSMKTIYAQLTTYVKEINALKVDFVKNIDEQIDKVEKGASLKELKDIDMKKIPDPPGSQNLFPGLDKYFSNSQMDLGLLNFGSLSQMPNAAVISPASSSTATIPPALSTPVISPPLISQAKPSNVPLATILPQVNTATIIPQATPSVTIIPQTLPSTKNIPGTIPSAKIISDVTPSAKVVPETTLSAKIITGSAPSAVTFPLSTPAATLISPIVSSAMPTFEAMKKNGLNNLNPQIQESFKNITTSQGSFSSIPNAVSTLDKEFNRTCAIFTPPESISNLKLNIPKVPPGIPNSTASSVSSKPASHSSKESLETFPSTSSKDSLETFPSVERTLASITSSKSEHSASILEQKKKIPGSKIGNSSYDKLLCKLREQYPLYSQEELISFVKEFRSRRQGKLTGLPIDSIISELRSIIQAKENEKKIHEQKLQPKPNKILVNKKIVPDPKVLPVSEQQNAKKKSAWGIDLDNKKVFSGNSDDDCTICCDPMSSSSAYKVGCGHTFHEECIRQWLKNKSNCPVCRVLLLLPEEYPSLS